MSASAAPVRDTPIATPKRVARTLDGRAPVDETDQPLPAPVVYYNPQHIHKKFRYVPGQYPLPQFSYGKVVVYTAKQEAVVRAILGANADRWQGDDPAADEDFICDHTGCGFATRNYKAFKDHRKYTGHMGE